MLFLGYSDKDYGSILQRFAVAMNTVLDEQGVLHLPAVYGEGFLKPEILPNQLQALLFDFTIRQDIFLNRVKSTEEFYTLCFDEVHIASNITIKMGREFFARDAHLRSAALLTSSLFDFGYIARKGTRAKGVHIIITRDWMRTYLGIGSEDKILSRYIALKSASFNFEPLDTDYRHLLNETLEENAPKYPMGKTHIQNRVMLLIERFFTRLYKKIQALPTIKPVSDQEIQQLMRVEYLLVRDFSVKPPTLPELARVSMMSQSKLKNLFKKVYDLNPYEYYQKNRMLRAKYLLSTREFSIKEIGGKLGFKNLSNFTIAFKKEFAMLPSDV